MTTKPQTLLPLPDPPEREPDDMTSFRNLTKTGNVYLLTKYLGNPDTTIVDGERFIIPEPGTPPRQRIYPDMLVSFNADPTLYDQDNGYVISRQGKPPDLVMEIASERTGRNDVQNKPARYAALGVQEYWRFDHTGNFHRTKLAGDRLVEGRYEPIDIEEVGEGILQGHSAVLDLLVRWEQGQLRWHDPATGQEIPTFEQERNARVHAESRAETAENRADTAEARVRELEAELNQRQQEG